MRYLRAAAAALTLIGVLAGIPALLAATVGNPAEAWPALAAGDMSDTVVVAVLAVIAWVAWAQFALAVATEALGSLTRIRLPRRMPVVFSGQRKLARALVVTAFMITPTAAPIAATVAVPAPAAAATVAMHTQSAVPRAAPSSASAEAASVPDQKTYVITEDGPATYWDLAEAFLGDGARWSDIWELNHGRLQDDGRIMSSPDLLRSGWNIAVPAEATVPEASGTTGHTVPATSPETIEQIRVQRGDTLSGIAIDHDVADWHRLWDANKGRDEPGGKEFTDPDLIYPGWTIDVPQASAGQNGATGTGQTAPDASLSPPATAEPSGPPSVAPSTAPQPAATATPVQPGTDINEQSSPVATGEAEPAKQGTSEVFDAGMGALAIGVFGAGGALLAGSSLLAFWRNRRRAWRHRRPGRTIAATPADLVATEKALLSAAANTDAVWLGQALTGLAIMARAGQVAAPDVLAARLHTGGLELVLATSHLKPLGAWMVGQDGLRWYLSRTAVTGYEPVAASAILAPYPALASVGYTDNGDTWLVDLERVGALALMGDADRCADLLRFVAAELAHNTWSDQLQVTVTGFGVESTESNSERVEVVADPSAAVAAVAVHVRTTAAVMQNAEVDVLDGRVRDIAADAWFPHVLLIAGPTPTGLQPLVEQIHQHVGRAAIAVVRADQPAGQGPSFHLRQVEARWELHVDAVGRLSIPALGLHMRAQQLPISEAGSLARLLTVAGRIEDEPMPDADGGNTWQPLADAAGALRAVLVSRADGDPAAVPTPPVLGNGIGSEPDMPFGPAPDTSFGPASTAGQQSAYLSDTDVPTTGIPGLVRRDRVLPLPEQTYLDTAATTATDIQTLSPQVPVALRDRIDQADPDLDTDLAAWVDSSSPRPKIRMLGPLTVVTTRGDLPADRPRKAWNTEVVAYLACHPRGVSEEQLGSDLWPDDPDIAGKSKLRQAIYIVRRWLGSDPDTGSEYLPPAAGSGGPGLYRIDGLLTDADLFRRLRLRGVAAGDAGITDLQAALNLVTGEPFADRRPGGFAWLADDPVDHTFTGMIVDVAHVVATHHLANGAPEAAEAAARVSLSAGSSDDIALLDLLAAYDAQDRRAEADRLVTRILTNHDAEVEEDLPPRTAEILRRRHWLDRAS